MSGYQNWRVKRTDNGVYERVSSATEPTVAPSDGGSIVTAKTVSLGARDEIILTNYYVNIESKVADAIAIKINASDAAGGVEVSTGTGGLALACNANAGPINIGNAAGSKNIVVGNTNGTTKLAGRFGTGGHTLSQPAPVAYSDADHTVTIAELITQIIYITPTVNRTCTLPTAALAVAGISGVAVNDSIDFSIINLASGSGDPAVVVAMGTSGTSVGRMNVDPYVNFGATYLSSGSGLFRLRFTNVTASSEAYVVYRIA